MKHLKTYDGDLQVPEGTQFAIVASRFNHFIVDRLVDGALDCLKRHGAEREHIVLVHVPGAWEVPLACSRLAHSKRFAAVIALSAVIRGSTPHFDYVAAEASKGTAQAMMSSQVPISFGILTTDTIEQAVERAGTKAGNKGWDAAMSAIEMVTLGVALKNDGL